MKNSETSDFVVNMSTSLKKEYENDLKIFEKRGEKFSKAANLLRIGAHLCDIFEFQAIVNNKLDDFFPKEELQKVLFEKLRETFDKEITLERLMEFLGNDKFAPAEISKIFQ